MNTPDIGILQQQAVELKLGLDHWRENAYTPEEVADEEMSLWDEPATDEA